MEYDLVIGLEVHAQLLTTTKAFCGCPATAAAVPNRNVCPVCLGLPGSLPVLNGKVVEYGIRLGLACNCRLNRKNVFARKNYFYPDLPKGYQITQHVAPLCENGYLEIPTASGPRRIGITRIHMEEDSGKSVHAADGQSSLMDYNRAGIPLLEIVSAPEIHSPAEAVAYLKLLRQILVYLEICDGNMEEGSFRCDANISVRPRGSAALGVRTELKNMNSFSNIQKALEYEAGRQVELKSAGREVVQETRLWDADRGVTRAMRGKEESHDYRYFPEPDLVPLVIDAERVAMIESDLPELPVARCRRFMAEYSLPEYDAAVLTQSRRLADYFEACVKILNRPKDISNWIMTEVLRVVKDPDRQLATFNVTPQMLCDLIEMLIAGLVSGRIAKEVFAEMLTGGEAPGTIVNRRGARQVSDATLIRDLARSVLAANPDQVAAYRGGKLGLLGFFVGQVMRLSEGKANPKLANTIIMEMLQND